MPVSYYEKPAILDQIPLDSHAVIEASAGTGKTYTIEHLFVELLLTKGVLADSILVLTYTEKAAGELRARIRSIIEKILSSVGLAQGSPERSWRIDEEARIKLARALFSFDKAPIHTIHGFFQRVIVENAFTSGRLFEQSLVDSKEQFSEAFKTVLRTIFARDVDKGKYLTCWLQMGKEDSVETLEDFLFTCHAKKRQLRPLFNAGEMEKALDSFSFLAAGDKGLEGLKAELKKRKVHSSTISAVIRKLLYLYGCSEKSTDNRNIPEFLCQLDSDALVYLEGKIGPFRSELPFIDAFMNFKHQVVSFDAAIAQEFLPHVQEVLSAEKRLHGLYDFDDMIALLWDALQGPQGIALADTLRARYKYVLIDESQDTDELQWNICRKVLCEGSGNVLYLVGDPKQAIYGFRGADVFTYLAAKSSLCGQGCAISLNQNYRSTPALIEAYNEIFSQSCAQPFFSGRITYDLPVACGQSELSAMDIKGREIVPVVLLQVVADGEKSMPYAEFKEALGARIASEIQTLLSPEGSVMFGKNGAMSPVSPRDIFILTRKEREGLEVAEHLRDLGIPYAFYKQDGLFQCSEAENVRDLLRAVDSPSDSSCRLKAWLTPFFEIRLEQLPSCRDLPESDPLIKTLFEWQALAKQRDFQKLFARIIDDSGIVRREIFLKSTERELTNYLHIFEILLEEASLSMCTLAELVRKLDDFISEKQSPARDNGNVQRIETEKEAVQIMTMHKSKGLEASVVFLFGGYTAFPEKDFDQYHDTDGHRMLYIYKGGAQDPEVAERAKQESHEEDQRLIYVAMTRAKARLYLPYADPGHIGPKMKEGPYAQLNQRLTALIPDVTGGRLKHLFALQTIAQYADGSASDKGESLPDLRKWKPDKRLLEIPETKAVFEQLKEKRAGFEVTSYSRIKALKGGYVSPVQIEEETQQTEEYDLSLLVKETVPGGLEYGVAIHEVLERLNFSTFAESPAFDEWQRREDVSLLFDDCLLKRGFDAGQVNYSKKIIHGALTAPVSLGGELTLPGMYSAVKNLRELEFIYPYPESFHNRLNETLTQEFIIERGFVKGFMDLIFEYEAVVYFADWKTDILGDYTADTINAHFSQNYELQARLYMIALVKMLGISDRDAYDKRIGGYLYCFLRGMSGQTDGSGVLFGKPSWDDVLKFEAELIENEYI